MEIWEQNYLTRSTCFLIVDGVTATASELLKRDPRDQLVSSGFNDDTTTTTLRIQLDADISTSTAAVINRIAIMQHNLQRFVVSTSADKSSTSGYLILTSTCQTTSSSWITNSQASHYLSFADLTATDIYIHMTETFQPNTEKAVGYLVISKKLYELPRIPSANNYELRRENIGVLHELSDGGKRLHILDENISANISYDYADKSFVDSLKSIYDSHDQFVFCPFPPTVTDATWDKILFPCQWHGDFDFHKLSDNAISAGNSGTIVLKETPR